MKKQILVAIAVVFIASASLVACKSNEEKTEAAESKVADAKENLQEVKDDIKSDSIRQVTVAEWKAFKEGAKLQISNNEALISELRKKNKNAGKANNAKNEKRIELLESENKNLNARIDNYENAYTNWQLFKNEFGQDMEKLGQALKDFTIDN